MDRKDKLHETIPEVSPAVPWKPVATPSPHDLALGTCDSTPIVPHAAALRRRTRSQRCHATLNRVPSDLRDEELQQLHLLRSAEESRPVHVGWQVAARSNGKIPGRKWWVVTRSSPPATASSVRLVRSKPQRGGGHVCHPKIFCRLHTRAHAHSRRRLLQCVVHFNTKTPSNTHSRALQFAVHTMSELKMAGNGLKGSRPILNFDSKFDEIPQLQLLKEMFIQTFGTPRAHPKSKPFVDRVMSFVWLDNRIWFRNYQAVWSDDPKNPDDHELSEIGTFRVL